MRNRITGYALGLALVAGTFVQYDEGAAAATRSPTAPKVTPTPTPTPEPPPAPTGLFALQGLWLEVPVDCAFCASFVDQNLGLSRDSTLLRFTDRLEIDPSLEAASLTSRGQGSEGNRELKVIRREKHNDLVLVSFARGDGERTSDLFARIWVVQPYAAGRLLYGQRYMISAFAAEAFEQSGKGYVANQKFLNLDRILNNLEDVRVYSLNETRKVYQPSQQVRFSLEGMVAFVREEFSPDALKLAKVEAAEQARVKSGRESLMRTLILQGDQSYSDGQLEDALQRYKAAATIVPEASLVHADLGAVYYAMNRLPEAESSLRLALELDPTDVDTIYNLGLLLEQSGRLNEAYDAYKQVLTARPNDVDARDRTTRLGKRLGR